MTTFKPMASPQKENWIEWEQKTNETKQRSIALQQRYRSIIQGVLIYDSQLEEANEAMTGMIAKDIIHAVALGKPRRRESLEREPETSPCESETTTPLTPFNRRTTRWIHIASGKTRSHGGQEADPGRHHCRPAKFHAVNILNWNCRCGKKVD